MHDGNEHMWLILYSLLFNGLHHSVQHLVQWNTLETLSFKMKFYFIPIFQWDAPFCATLSAVEHAWDTLLRWNSTLFPSLQWAAPFCAILSAVEHSSDTLF